MCNCEAPNHNLTVAETHTEPFPYFLADRCLAADLERDLLDWFDAGAPWRLVETDFYEQYEFSLFDVEGTGPAQRLVSPAALADVRQIMEDALACRLTDEVELTAHKLVDGQRIGIHNDYLVGQETHRLTIQLNRGLRDPDGGFFMLFGSDDASDVHRIMRPISNTGIGFAIGPSSHHAVSRVHGGSRYTLVYSFHAQPRP